MKKYKSPEMIIISNDEMEEMILAGASCPNCYQCGTYNASNCG